MQDIAEEIRQAGTGPGSHVAGTPDRELRIEIRSRYPLRPALPAELARLSIQVDEQSRLLRLSGVGPEAGQLSVLADPLAEAMCLDGSPNDGLFVDMFCRPGVTDAEGEMATQALAEAGLPGISCRAGTRFRLGTAVSPADRERVERLLGNPLIHELTWSDLPARSSENGRSARLSPLVETIELISRNDSELLEISRRYALALDLEEMRAIASHFAVLGRNPTDVELQSIALAWSEHCSHKTFRAPIELWSHGRTETIPGLLRTYLIEPARQLQRRWVRSAFVDNAGIVVFDREYDLAIKVETHNHPSALEPFGGAHTGVGGVIRDVLAVSATPIANTDVLCFGPLDLPDESVPAGAFHPATTFEGVVRGIADYGNNMGIPTVGGAVLFHPGYSANPLVYCGTVGIAPRGSHPTNPQPGDLVVLLGGRTGRDGLNGATMSSATLDRASVAGSTVQIGAPIVEKTVRDVIPHLRDERLYHAITDCGAGGLCSAVGEMGEHLGVEVELDRVPLKYEGLAPWEIWLSEAQERMVLAVPPSALPRLLEICRTFSAEATAIGRFRDDGILALRHVGRDVGQIEIAFLHGGCPVRTLEARWEPVPGRKSPAGEVSRADEALLSLLSHPTIASKENIIRRYDHEVQAATIVKPLCGRSGPSDGMVLRPISESERGVALAHGINPLYGESDPHAMAMLAVDEALRNLVAAGGSIDRAALLDNFCWGDIDDPMELGGLVRAVQGCRDAMETFGVPFISGKDSLRNTSVDAAGRKSSIPGTLLVTALGVLPDVSCAITMDLKETGNRIYLLGQTRDELGGSHYRWIRGDQGGSVPQVRVHETPRLMRRLTRAIRKGLIRSCHDLSEGGLAVAAAEMAIAGGLGLSVDLAAMPADCAASEALLFAESPGRFLVEVEGEKCEEFERLLAGLPAGWIGVITDERRLVLRHGERTIVDLGCDELDCAWNGGSPPALPAMSLERTEAEPEPRRRTMHQRGAATRVRALILAAPGINCDRETVDACDRAGARAEAVHLNQLLDSRYRLGDFGFLVLPGGFSYGDHLGAGAMLATILRHRFMEDLSRFVDEGRPVLGICNGFQVLTRLGLLGDITLIPNISNRFECRWVPLRVEESGACRFLDGLDELELPIAHGQGRLETGESLSDLLARAPLRYRQNPNGSVADIAGVANAAGNVFGLMPHPERFLTSFHHPGWTRSVNPRPPGLTIFQNAVRMAESL